MSDKTKVFNSSKAPEPVGAYPHARRVGDFLFLSGVGPRQAGTDRILGQWPHDIELQTQAVIDNVRIILRDSHAALEQVVDIQVFLTDMERDFKGFNQVYNTTFKDIGPTRTTIEVGSLPTPIAVEFKVIAYLGQ